MRIGIDLDGVLFDTEKAYRVYSELYDLMDLKQNSKINNQEIKFQKRFKWTEEQLQGFINKYHEKIVTESNFMPGAIDVIRMLKNDGHKLFLITARGGINEHMIEITEDILKLANLEVFDKYYWKTENKDEICLKEKIDIMIDDSYEKCMSIAKAKIKVIYFKDAPSYDINNEYVTTLYNWGEVYRYIKEQNNNML